MECTYKRHTTNKAEIKDEIGGANEHIYVDSGAQITSWNIANGGIVLDIGSGAILGEMYSYDNIIAGSLNDGVNGSKLAIGTVQGVRLNKGEKGFSFELDATDSSGARALQGITNSGMQRNITNQSIYNSVLSSNFGSVSVANNAQDLTIKHHAKAYARAKFHNYYKSVVASSAQNQRYIKLTHNPDNKIFVSYANANELDSAESTQDSTHSIQSQNYAQDFANDSARNYATAQHSTTNDKRLWNVFLVPYVAHSSSKMDNSSDSNAFSAGLLGGIQVDLGTGGILGGYIGYGYDNNKLELSRSNMTSINHSVQIGIQHIKYFDLETNSSNATRWFIRGGIRANIDNPTLKSNDNNGTQNKAHLFSYGIGVHLSEGVEFKLPESSMYHKANLTPEFSLSYDKMIINTYDLGNDKYPRQVWNLPQVGVALKWQSYWNPYFYSTMLAGVKYNIINKQSIELIKAGNAAKSAISLPSAYGHLEISGTWIVEQFHEVSLSYAGIYFGGGSAKGVMNSLSLKWGYSF